MHFVMGQDPGYSSTTTWRSAFAFGLLVLIAASMGMAVAAVERSAVFLTQPSARLLLMEPLLALAAYAFVIVLVVMRRGAEWEVELRNAAVFGGLAGLIEIANIAIENGIPFAVRGPVLQIAAMLLIFALWGMAGARTARELGTFRSGVLAAVLSAAACMVVGVTAGFALELFAAPPEPGYVATWAEFRRSGWSDPGAFGIANTLNSGFSHLLIAPVVAMVVGGIGASIGRVRLSKG